MLLKQFLFEVKRLPDTLKADAFGLDLQQEYVRWCAQTFGHSASYIARIMNPIAAAMHFAAEEQAIEDPDRRVRTVRLMSHAPKIRFHAAWIAEVAAIAAPQRRDWLPTIEEMARFVDCLRAEHAFRFWILLLNTWARTESILELDLKRQVKEGRSLVDLNPSGRLQTHKRRPLIRLTRNLAAWRATWLEEARVLNLPKELIGRPLLFRGAPVDGVKRALEAASARWMFAEAGYPPSEIARLTSRGHDRDRYEAVRKLREGGQHPITSRVGRSFMSTTVTDLAEIIVPDREIETWLGHKDQSTTAYYKLTSPNYLRHAADATDLVIEKIGTLSKRSLWPEGAQADLPFLRVVKG